MSVFSNVDRAYYAIIGHLCQIHHACSLSTHYIPSEVTSVPIVIHCRHAINFQPKEHGLGTYVKEMFI